VHKALAYTTNPYIPGLSGEEDKCLAFVTNIGLDIKKGDRWIAVNDLSTEQKQTLFSELAKYMASKKLGTAVMNLVGTVYTLVYEDRGKPLRDGREHASLLNACGRMNKTGLGVAIGLGNRDAILTEALEAFTRYKKTLSDYMEWISTNPRSIETHENIFVINGTGVIDERMISTVSSIVTSSGLISEPKPIVAMTEAEGGKIKVSGRLPDELKGKVNLGLIFHEATEKIGGVGGGHDVAAGAEFSKENEAEFVKLVDESVGRMLSTQKTDK
jgi:RecJ-like exonuclease